MSAKLKVSYTHTPELLDILVRLGDRIATQKVTETPEGGKMAYIKLKPLQDNKNVVQWNGKKYPIIT